MFDPFEGITGQRQLTDYLRTAYEGGNVTHAYLIVGGSEAPQIARAFAAALVSDGDAGSFELALRGSHPDLRTMAPGSAAGYLVEQAREVVRDARLAPVRASRKVYVMEQAEALRPASANALLKTLEEPPEDVVIVMLAASEQSVLETIRSRCQVLVCTSSAARVQSDAELDAMLTAIARGAGNRQVLAFSRRLVELSDEGSDELKEQQAAELEAHADYLTPGARKEAEQRHKRELTALKRENLLRQIASMRAYLRDCLAINQGAADLAAPEGLADKTDVATSLPAARIVQALDALSEAESRISYNVTPQLATDALLLEIREALCPQLP